MYGHYYHQQPVIDIVNIIVSIKIRGVQKIISPAMANERTTAGPAVCFATWTNGAKD